MLLAFWGFLSKTWYFLQKRVPFTRCCTSRNFCFPCWTFYLVVHWVLGHNPNRFSPDRHNQTGHKPWQTQPVHDKTDAETTLTCLTQTYTTGQDINPDRHNPCMTKQTPTQPQHRHCSWLPILFFYRGKIHCLSVSGLCPCLGCVCLACVYVWVLSVSMLCLSGLPPVYVLGCNFARSVLVI